MAPSVVDLGATIVVGRFALISVNGEKCFKVFQPFQRLKWMCQLHSRNPFRCPLGPVRRREWQCEVAAEVSSTGACVRPTRTRAAAVSFCFVGY